MGKNDFGPAVKARIEACLELCEENNFDRSGVDRLFRVVFGLPDKSQNRRTAQKPPKSRVLSLVSREE